MTDNRDVISSIFLDFLFRYVEIKLVNFVNIRIDELDFEVRRLRSEDITCQDISVKMADNRDVISSIFYFDTSKSKSSISSIYGLTI